MVDVGLDSAPLGAGPVEVVLGQRLRDVTVGVGSGGAATCRARTPGSWTAHRVAAITRTTTTALRSLPAPRCGEPLLSLSWSLPRRAHGSPLAGFAGPVRTTAYSPQVRPFAIDITPCPRTQQGKGRRVDDMFDGMPGLVGSGPGR